MFATSLGGHLFGMLVAGCLLVYAVVKIVAAADGEGEVKKAAKDGFAECFRKIFKL